MVQELQREAQISQAAQQEAAAVSRAFAAMSAAALVVDVARVQESLAGSWRTSGLADAMVIDHGNRVFAASMPAMSDSRFRMRTGPPFVRRIGRC